MNKDLKKYLKEIKILFPSFGWKERKYFNLLKKTIITESDESTTYDDYIEYYGAPKDVMLEYYNQYDSQQFISRFRRKHYLLRVGVIFTSCLLVLLLFQLVTSILLSIEEGLPAIDLPTKYIYQSQIVEVIPYE